MPDEGKTREQLLDELGALRMRVEELEGVVSRMRAAEMIYRGLLDAIDDGIHVNDAKGRCLLVNAETARRHGWSPEEFLGKNVDEIYDAERGRLLTEEYRLVMATGEPIDVERYYPGEQAPYRHIHRTPMRDEAGRIVAVVSVSRDVTARKLAEKALERERDFSSVVIDTIGSLLVVLDTEAHIVRMNRACERITGYSFEEVKGKPFWMVFPPVEGDGGARDAFQSALQGQPTTGGENLLVTRDWERRLIAWSNTPLFDSAGRVEYVVSAGSDITEQRRAEMALKESNDRLVGWVRDLEQRNQEGALINKMGDLLQSCRSFDEAYSVVGHLGPQLFPEMVGALYVMSSSRNLADAVATWGDFPDEERVFAPDECWALRRGRIHVVDNLNGALICRHVGRSGPDSYICVPMMAQGEILGSLHLRVSGGAKDPALRIDGAREQDPALRQGGNAGSDVASAREQLAVTVAEHVALALANLNLQQTLRDQAIHDLLTGLFNRRYMEEMLDRELLRAKRRASTVGVVMIDIDHFKQFNDVYSHEGGDALLSVLGSYLRTHVRGEDVVCRYGGEEITLVLPDSSLEDTLSRAEELREGIKRLQVEHRRRLLAPVTVSMGIAAFPEHGATREAVLHAADLALYQAKAQGRDRVVVAG